MVARTELKLDRRFRKQAKGRIEKYTFDVGILQDGPHKNAVSKANGLKSYAGGPARKTGRRTTGTLSEVSESLRRNTGINFYTKPFRSKTNKDLLKVIKAFWGLFSGRGERKRLENALQAVVRNPILRGDYGKNTPATAKAKGFNRFMIDTAQLFKGIKARVRVKNVS